jgi:hypothetical protein
MHASILVQLSSFVHHFLFSLSLYWYLLFVLIDHRKGKKASYYGCCLFSFSLSQPKILPASVHTHIYQSEEVRVLARRFFFSSYIGQI